MNPAADSIASLTAHSRKGKKKIPTRARTKKCDRAVAIRKSKTRNALAPNPRGEEELSQKLRCIGDDSTCDVAGIAPGSRASGIDDRRMIVPTKRMSWRPEGIDRCGLGPAESGPTRSTPDRIDAQRYDVWTSVDQLNVARSARTVAEFSISTSERARLNRRNARTA